MRSSPIAAGVAVLAIATAGCASAGAGGPGAAKGAATVVPANAVGFVAASTDLSSAAWHGLGEVVLKQVPAWSKELAPVAGDEVDVALLPGDKAVAFVQPTDESKLDALATAHGAKVRKIGDWTAVAHDAKTLDTVAGATSHLSDNTLFEEAMGRLPDGALVRAYANAGEAKRLLASLPGAQDYRWVAAAVTSTDAGLKLEAFAAQRVDKRNAHFCPHARVELQGEINQQIHGHFGLWLDPKEHRPEKLLPLITPYPANRMECWPVSDRVNSARVEEPGLNAAVTPVGSS